jgi:hypothetical protein
VADEQVGEAVAGLQFAQQLDDLRLHRHVERRGWLVGHDKPGLQHECAGDRHALALAAGEFVRVALGRLGVEPDLSERGLDEPSALAGARRKAVHPEPLLDDLRDRQPRREGLQHDRT